MRRPDAFRQHVNKNDKGKVNEEGWTISQNERGPTAYQVRARVTRHHSLLLWMLRLALASAVLVGVSPYLHEEDLSVLFARLLSFGPAPPVDSGDRNGLLHK